MSATSTERLRGSGGRPKLALTLGDPAGIGPEIVAAALRDPRVEQACELVLIGPDYLRAEVTGGVPVEYRAIDIHDGVTADGGTADDGPLTELPFAFDQPLERVPLGRASVDGGRAALAALRRGHELALAGEVDALVTAPVCKEAMHLAGERVEGQTQLLARWAGAVDCQMMAIAGQLRCLIATRHMPLVDAIGSLTPELIEARLRLLHSSLVELGFPQPHLALAGLNPHASEGGLFGDEEERILQPALDAVRADGLRVTGPEPPDTLFGRALAGHFDAVLALYHDQGFIPVKLAAPQSALTLLLGMPYLRISPAHGTAFDIAGKGLADPENQIGALLAAAEFARARAAHA